MSRMNVVCHQCKIQQEIIGVQITALKLNQPNLGEINPGLFAVSL